ncbi:MAG TPA: Gp49 family protein [Dongiaceae bacterium]|nr:Gp49 family protein [Dongiaceae bacterium]
MSEHQSEQRFSDLAVEQLFKVYKLAVEVEDTATAESILAVVNSWPNEGTVKKFELSEWYRLVEEWLPGQAANCLPDILHADTTTQTAPSKPTLPGPKLTVADLEATIVGEAFWRLGESTATVCQLRLRNGFVVEGISHCAAPENFNQEEGEKWARKAAFEKIWDLEGYLLKERLHQKETLRGKIFEISPNRVSQWPTFEELDQLQLQMANVDDPEELREALAVLIKGVVNYYNYAGDRIVHLTRDAIELQKQLEKTSQKTNFQLTSEINTIVGNHPTGDVRAWRRQAGLIRDEVVELLGHIHMDALFKFDFEKICEQFIDAYGVVTDEGGADTEMDLACEDAKEFLKLFRYQNTLFTQEDLPGATVNPYAVRDDIQDILVTAYGLSHRMGFDADEDHREVYRSNLTKFDTTPEGAAATQEKYAKFGIKTSVHRAELLSETRDEGAPLLYIVKVDGTQTGNDGKVYPDGKFLKSLNFEEPNYKPVISRQKLTTQSGKNSPSSDARVDSLVEDFGKIRANAGSTRDEVLGVTTDIDAEARMATIHIKTPVDGWALRVFNFIEEVCLPNGIAVLHVGAGDDWYREIHLDKGERIIPVDPVGWLRVDITKQPVADVYANMKETVGSNRDMQKDFVASLEGLKQNFPELFADSRDTAFDIQTGREAGWT